MSRKHLQYCENTIESLRNNIFREKTWSEWRSDKQKRPEGLTLCRGFEKEGDRGTHPQRACAVSLAQWRIQYLSPESRGYVKNKT